MRINKILNKLQKLMTNNLNQIFKNIQKIFMIIIYLIGSKNDKNKQILKMNNK